MTLETHGGLGLWAVAGGAAQTRDSGLGRRADDSATGGVEWQGAKRQRLASQTRFRF